VTLPEVVAAGSRRASLEALRDLLATSLVEVDPDKRAPLAKQLTDVLRDIEELSEPEGSKLDDLAARRAARLADATGTDPT
jgi:ribosomal protein L12E/L44/L45/RPP1/RPP2